ncbi:MAG: hypothetical protein ACRCXB_31395 [Aeromonadaceae bacterium]
MNESTLVPREETSDLDWLARNVHEWPTSTPHIVPAGDSVFEFGITLCENHACVYHREYTDSKVIYKKQWLARRAELQNKPSWKDAPQDASYLAQEPHGMWTFFFDRPYEPSKLSDDGWRFDGFQACCSECRGEVLGDWRDTLEKRPYTNEMPSHSNQPKPSTDIQECAEVKQFEQLVSVEDEEVAYYGAAADAAKEYLAKCAERAATAKQPAPKGSGNPILGMVLADLTNRALEGKEKYGEPLLANNGRNALWDLYQELLDAAMYIRQAIEEQKK